MTNTKSGLELHPLTARNEKSILYREPDGVLAYLGRCRSWVRSTLKKSVTTSSGFAESSRKASFCLDEKQTRQRDQEGPRHCLRRKGHILSSPHAKGSAPR